MGSPTNSAASAISRCRDELGAFLGADHLHPASRDDNVAGLQPAYVVEPNTCEDLARVLRVVDNAGLAAIPRGNGTKLAWGTPPRAADVVVSTLQLNRVVEHAWEDLTATVESGCTVQQLQTRLAEHGQRLAIDVLWPDRATIGGILATNDSGSLRLRFGGLRDLIIGATLVLPNGTIARSGGKVVKNVAGYDLMKLATGSFGTLALIASAVFRLHPLPREERTIGFVAQTPQQATEFVLAVLNSTLVPTGLQIRTGSSSPIHIDVRFEGTISGIDRQVQGATAAASGMRPCDCANDVWSARQQLWDGSDGTIAKVTFLPSGFARLTEAIAAICARAPQPFEWQIVAHAHGIAYLRVQGDNNALLAAALSAIRAEIEQSSGSLTLLECVPAVKNLVGVWGTAGDSLPLAQRIKQRFDPRSTLNPGRFLGGI